MRPIWRASSGGIETVIEAYDRTDARSPLNMSPESAVERCRVVTTRIGTWDAPSVDCVVATRTPCAGRPAQPTHVSANKSTSAIRTRLKTKPHGHPQDHSPTDIVPFPKRVENSSIDPCEWFGRNGMRQCNVLSLIVGLALAGVCGAETARAQSSVECHYYAVDYSQYRSANGQVFR